MLIVFCIMGVHIVFGIRPLKQMDGEELEMYEKHYGKRTDI